MKAGTDGWESYTDRAGRRHWRWPAAADPLAAARSGVADAGPRKKIGWPGQQPARQWPLPPTGK